MIKLRVDGGSLRFRDVANFLILSLFRIIRNSAGLTVISAMLMFQEVKKNGRAWKDF